MDFPARQVKAPDCQLNWDALRALLHVGNGSPESVVAARIGSLYLRQDGGAGSSLYVKESGTGKTGWVAK